MNLQLARLFNIPKVSGHFWHVNEVGLDYRMPFNEGVNSIWGLRFSANTQSLTFEVDEVDVIVRSGIFRADPLTKTITFEEQFKCHTGYRYADDLSFYHVNEWWLTTFHQAHEPSRLAELDGKIADLCNWQSPELRDDDDLVMTTRLKGQALIWHRDWVAA